MFEPKSIELSGRLSVAAPVDAAFELFSPLGEKRWVPGWDPELLHPAGAVWARGLVFRTQEERGDAVWVVAALDRARHQVEYWRIEADRYVATVSVRCEARSDGKTGVHVAYAYVGLSEAGNRDIAAMSQPAFDQKMTCWQGWIEAALASGRGRKEMGA